MCFEIHRYLQNKFYLRKNYNHKCFALFEVICLLKLVRLLTKSVLFTKSGCLNLAAKFYAVNLLNS